MICKWCGAVVSTVDRKCGRCGREIPAMSDCGGFYDLVPNARAAAPAAVPVAAPVVPPAPNPEELARRAAAKKKAEQMALVRLGVFALVALIIVIMLIMMIAKMSVLGKRLDALELEMADLNRDFSAHLKDASEPRGPFQDLDDVPQNKPDDKPGFTRPQDMPTIDPPDMPAPELECWNFTVGETPDNGQSFASELVRLELPVADGRLAEDGICFELPDSAKVVLICEDGSASITITGPWLEDYSEFADGTFSADAEVSNVTCQCLSGEEGVVYTMAVSDQLNLFFQSLVEEGADCGKICILAIEQTEADEQFFRLSLEKPEKLEIEESGANAEG